MDDHSSNGLYLDTRCLLLNDFKNFCHRSSNRYWSVVCCVFSVSFLNKSVMLANLRLFGKVMRAWFSLNKCVTGDDFLWPRLVRPKLVFQKDPRSFLKARRSLSISFLLTSLKERSPFDEIFLVYNIWQYKIQTKIRQAHWI